MCKPSAHLSPNAVFRCNRCLTGPAALSNLRHIHNIGPSGSPRLLTIEGGAPDLPRAAREPHSRADEGNVGEGLWEVADPPFRTRVVLLGEEAYIVR